MDLQQAREIMGLSEYEEQIMQTYNLSYAQIKWRRNTIKDKLNGDTNLFKQEYP